MEKLLKLKDNVLDYFSPKRRRTTAPSTPSTQIIEELHEYLPNTDPQGTKAQEALRYRISQKYLTPLSDTRFGPGSRKRPRESDTNSNMEVKMSIEAVEEAQFVSNELEAESLSPHESASQISPQGSEAEDEEDQEDFDGELADEGELVREDELSAEDKVKAYLARQAELESKKGEIEKIKASGDWHPDEVFLFERLALRSFEPLLPADWIREFPTLPDEIFAADGKAFITAKEEWDNHGVRALQAITQLGSRLNLNLDNHATRLRTGINAYIRWADRNGGYDKLRFIPVIVVLEVKNHHTTTQIMKRLNDQLHFLAAKHREYLSINEPGEVETYTRRPPLLYGLVIVRSSVFISTLDSANPNAVIRNIHRVDFSAQDQSFWNGLAVALTVCCARTYTMSIKDELEPDDEEPDPDL